MSDVVGAGATRIWNMTGSGAMAVGLAAGSNTNGVISGAAGSNLIKRGAQQLALRGNNTYAGYTQIDRGEIVITGDVLADPAGPLGSELFTHRPRCGRHKLGGQPRHRRPLHRGPRHPGSRRARHRR